MQFHPIVLIIMLPIWSSRDSIAQAVLIQEYQYQYQYLIQESLNRFPIHS